MIQSSNVVRGSKSTFLHPIFWLPVGRTLKAEDSVMVAWLLKKKIVMQPLKYTNKCKQSCLFTVKITQTETSLLDFCLCNNYIQKQPCRARVFTVFQAKDHFTDGETEQGPHTILYCVIQCNLLTSLQPIYYGSCQLLCMWFYYISVIHSSSGQMPNSELAYGLISFII